jgi:L-xylulokinase
VAEDKRYLLGLDAGNTVIKAVLFDTEGRQLAACGIDGQSSTPTPGHVERDLCELWRNAGEAIRACVEEAGIDPSRIAAIGCAGHGNGLYLLDRADKPLAGIQSIDTRAAGLAEELAAQHAEALHAICLQEPWPSQTPVLLAWMRRERPEIYARAGTVLMCKDFITLKLTGRKVSEISDMSGAGLLRMPDCTYDGALLDLYGLADARHLLPRLIDPADIAGTVTEEAAAQTGLAEGTPVIGGFFDVIASALGSGVVAPGEASIIAGTWSINQVVSRAPVTDRRVFMVSGFGPGRFMNMENSATSASNLEWYVREFIERGTHHDDPFAQCNERVGDITPRHDDPMFHPFLYGSRLGAGHRAGFYGVGGWHGEGHLLRALFEGVMFEHRRHVEVLEEAGVNVERAVLSGGGSRSPHWPQIFADGLGIEITVAEARETGALGAAIGAAIAAGIHPDYEAALAAMTRPLKRYVPNPDMQTHYDRRFGLYRELVDRMGGFWDKLQKDG